MECVWFDQNLTELEADVLIVPLVSNVTPSSLKGFEPHLATRIETELAHGDWKGKPNELTLFYLNGSVLSNLKRVLLVGMGSSKKWAYDHLRESVATGIKEVHRRGYGRVGILLPSSSTPASVRDLATIVQMALYDFSHYKTGRKPSIPAIESILLTNGQSGDTSVFQQALSQGTAIGQAVRVVRDLGNHPSNQMTPDHFARDAVEMADDRIGVRVFDRAELEELKLGGILAVGQGSANEPKLVTLEYRPKRVTKSTPIIALVGKGITFDSGGISIKPSEAMDEMKLDMAGAATCVGVIAAARALDLPLRIVAICPLAENLPSDRALKPGDIITAYNGKTIEVLNTDAEGRIVLADGLSFAAKEYRPDAIIDLATLTGAALVVLGHVGAPMMGNDDGLMAALSASAKRTNERVWPLPLWEEYKEQVKSEIADVKNLGDGRNAGVIAGAAFLANFVPKSISWVHLDIAGTSMVSKPINPYTPKGGTGWGVRLLVDFLEHYS